MAELTKIYTGMEKGPEAIWANDQALNKQTQSGGPIASKEIKVNKSGVTGGVVFYRQGTLCMAAGWLEITNSFSDMIVEESEMPAGYSNSTTQNFAAIVGSVSHAFLGSWVRSQGKGIKLMTTNGTTADSGPFSLLYHTDDDFPS